MSLFQNATNCARKGKYKFKFPQWNSWGKYELCESYAHACLLKAIELHREIVVKGGFKEKEGKGGRGRESGGENKVKVNLTWLLPEEVLCARSCRLLRLPSPLHGLSLRHDTEVYGRV